MPDVDEARGLLAFERWAGCRVLEAVESLLAPDPHVLALAGHLFAAAEEWLARLEGRRGEAPLWSEPSLDELRALAGHVDAALGGLAAALDAAPDAGMLDREVTYRNSQGREFTNSAGDILLHLALHGAEHRGQIFHEVGRLGGRPPETEYIWWVREPPEGD